MNSRKITISSKKVETFMNSTNFPNIHESLNPSSPERETGAGAIWCHQPINALNDRLIKKKKKS